MTNNLAEAMPFAKVLGIEVLEATPDRIVATMTVRPDLTTAGGIMHGGAIMAFADSLGGIGAFLTLPKDAKGTTTIESKTNFIGALPEGSVVTGETTPIQIGRRISIWQTRITRADGKLAALVTQTQMVL